MEHRDAFSGYHPLVNALYFALVLLCTMFLMHPVSLAISLGCALAYGVSLRGGRAVRSGLWYLLPMAALAALVNPAFNHRGATILAYLPSGNPLTLESIVYGLAAAAMLAAVLTWFSCCSAVMTCDKFVYLFGRVAPALSLVLSMALRFVPRFKAQLSQISQAQRCMGRDVFRGRPLERLKNAAAILSILATWSMENAIETADSMKSRGYGLPGRTAFSIYSFQRRDKAALLWLLLCASWLLAAWLRGGLAWRYYPTIRGSAGWLAVSAQLVYLALCLTPLILNTKEDRTWKSLRSRI